MSDIGLTVRWNNSGSSENLKNDRRVYLSGNHFIGRCVPSWCLTHYTLLQSGKDYYILKQFQDALSEKVKLAVFLNFWHIRIDMTHCVTSAILKVRISGSGLYVIFPTLFQVWSKILFPISNQALHPTLKAWWEQLPKKMLLGCVILKVVFSMGSSKAYSLYKVYITLHFTVLHKNEQLYSLW